MKPSPNYARFMGERNLHMTNVSKKGKRAPGHVAPCSPYLVSEIDIFELSISHLVENQDTDRDTFQSSLLHIPLLILPNTLRADPRSPLLYPCSNSPYHGGDLDITGESISTSSDPQLVTFSTAHTAVLHIPSQFHHIGAHHHRKQLAFRVRDSSGKPGAPSSARGLAADSPTRLHLSRGTPKQTN